jgi:cation diffusion facilitator CzcD-associated flavoprotein CzcO
VGGGQAGLSIAARLAQRGIDALIIDRWPRIGDNWRQRYHALTLHNQVHVNHLPYMPFSAQLAGLYPEGQARRLVRGLRRGDGDQLLEGH